MAAGPEAVWVSKDWSDTLHTDHNVGAGRGAAEQRLPTRLSRGLGAVRSLERCVSGSSCLCWAHGGTAGGTLVAKYNQEALPTSSAQALLPSPDTSVSNLLQAFI